MNVAVFGEWPKMDMRVSNRGRDSLVRYYINYIEPQIEHNAKTGTLNEADVLHGRNGTQIKKTQRR